MKELVFLTGLFIALSVQANTIYEGYSSFYSSLPNRMFKETGKTIRINDQTIWLNGKSIALATAVVFPGESVFDGDLGRAPLLFKDSERYCLEGQSNAASGTAVRHRAVYLIYGKSLKTYKLPSLFSSCISIGRNADNNPTFFEATIVNYRSAYDADGLRLVSYTLRNGMFERTKSQIKLSFVQPDNFYRFKVDGTIDWFSGTNTTKAKPYK
ncbi:hypothetical protein PQR63_07605 [Herbaspirillum rhizosphaerae]|uniref:Uncharacterized protein n=1 Tax=Herbaspirillum rhizosphaerae TaxID=346179 RepID=A0ABW8Z5B0_9BURK